MATCFADTKASSSELISIFYCGYLGFQIPGGYREFQVLQVVTNLGDKKDNEVPVTVCSVARFIFLLAGNSRRKICVCKV